MSIDKNVPPFVAHFDGNQVPTMMAVEGTLGTADTGGTARPLPVGVNPTTGALYVQDLSGASGTTNVQIVGGTFNAGTVTTTLALNTGTITTIAAGTQNTLGTVGTVIGVGTITNLGSITNIGNLPTLNLTTGTITTGSITDVAKLYNGSVNILTGTIQSSGTTTGIGTITNIGSVTNVGNSGTTTGVGVVSNLTNGSVNVLTGTLAVSLGTVGGKAASGAAAVANPVQIAGTDSGGTVYSPLVTTAGAIGSVVGIAGLNTGTVTLVSTVTTVSNLTAGSVRMTVGTMTTGSLTDLTNLYSGSVRMTVGTLTTGTLQNLVTGTINALAAGTITGGTLGNLNYGTIAIDAKPAGSTILTTHTLGTGGGTFFGTMISAVGAGTYIYLTGISIVARSGGSVDCGLASNVAGTTGAGVIARGFFPTAGGGIRQEFNPALRVGTNGTLAYFLITAGTVDFTAQYWVGP